MNDPDMLPSNETRELFLYDEVMSARSPMPTCAERTVPRPIAQCRVDLRKILVGIRPDRGV
jgi:hypothetical protein